MSLLRVLWDLTKGYRFTPWQSPYLRWRIETYWGIPAESITKSQFLEFGWQHRSELFRYLLWAARERSAR